MVLQVYVIVKGNMNKNLAVARGGKELTVNQRQWLREYLKHGNATEAAMVAYDCKDRASAGSLGSRNKKDLAFYIHILMEEEGINDKKLVNKLKEGLEATVMYKGVEYPDHKTRLKYIKEVKRWKDDDQGKSSAQTNIGEVKILVNRGE